MNDSKSVFWDGLIFVNSFITHVFNRDKKRGSVNANAFFTKINKINFQK